ncbi:MAG: redoxin domain-containing protein [Kiloniellaceae bacterium]
MTPASGEPLRLEVGDRVPDMGWVDLGGARVSLGQSAHAGRVTVVFVCPSAAGAARELTKFRDLHDKFRALEVQVFAVTSDPVPESAALVEKLELPFPVLFDAAFAGGRALGLIGPGAASPEAVAKDKGGAWCTVIVDPNQRVEKIFGPGAEAGHAVAAYAYCEKRAAGPGPTVVGMHAPVLIVPNVLSREHCARLIRFWETGQRYEGGVASADHGRNVPLSKIKVREDVALPDLGPEAQELFAVFRRRLFPEVRKAHNFRITRAETLRVGCYTASEGGHFTLHRDDTTPYTAHRRFAMSLNLNAGEYEGGYLRFPEYGPQLYSPDTGGAVVFSCSLLHDATRVTRGRRFVLLGFFYGEAEQALRDRLAAQRRAAPAGRAS